MSYPSIYHIGCMKTGTTAIQAVLRKDPRIELIEHSRFFNTARWFTNSYPSITTERWTVESDENIARCYGGMSGPRTALERIRSVRPDARIVLTLREPSSALLSGYKHHVRQTFDPYSFETFLRSDAGISFRNMLQYDRLLKDVLAFFPREQVHLFLYEDLKADPETFYESFYLDLFGISAPEGVKEEKRTGIPPSRLRLKRSLNRLKLFRSNTWAHPVDAALIRGMFRGIGYFFPKKGDDREFLEECPYYELVRKEFAESNARLLRMVELPLEEKGYELGKG